MTPLHWAADQGNKPIVKILIAANAYINATDSRDMTPQHLAAFNGHAVVLKELLNHNADINAKNNQGSTPLDLASMLRESDAKSDTMQTLLMLNMGMGRHN